MMVAWATEGGAMTGVHEYKDFYATAQASNDAKVARTTRSRQKPATAKPSTERLSASFGGQ